MIICESVLTIDYRRCGYTATNFKQYKCLYIMYVLFLFALGNDGFFQVERCNFTGNEGFQNSTDFGGALAISLVTLFIEAVTLPRHEVKDW